MCCGNQRSLLSRDAVNSPATAGTLPGGGGGYASAVQNIRDRLAQMEVLLARSRAREAELTRMLEERKRFLSVMQILEDYLKRRFRQTQEQVALLLSSSSSSRTS